MGLYQRDGGGGLWLQTQERQDLCGAAAAEQPMLKVSSEHRTVDLANHDERFSECFSPWSQVYGEQEDRKVDIHLQVYT